MGILDRPLAELTDQDIERLFLGGVPESQEIEFKRTLPAGGDGIDRWMRDQTGIGDHARNQLAREVVGFANAYGGVLVIGISETDDHPHRSHAIDPLPRVHDLADRLGKSLTAVVQPPIPLLAVRGIGIRGEDSGVVVIHVPRSRNAPHRHEPSKECYVRRADRTEPMTMREIQDLTLRMERGVDRIERKFDALNAQIEYLWGRSINGMYRKLALWSVATPIDDFELERVHGIPALAPHFRTFRIRGHDWPGDTESVEAHAPRRQQTFRPMLRGTKSDDESEGGGHFCSLSNAGDIVQYASLRWVPPAGRAVYLDWITGVLASTLHTADAYRTAAGAPMAEYALEIGIRSDMDLPLVQHAARSHHFGDIATLDAGVHRLPRYSVGMREEFQDLATLIDIDLLNEFGRQHEYRYLVDFDPA